MDTYTLIVEQSQVVSRNNNLIELPCGPRNDFPKTPLIPRIAGKYEPNVYLIREVSTGIFYIGSRTKQKCKDSDIGTKYFTSSKFIKWKENITAFEVLNVFPCESNRVALWFEGWLIDVMGAVKSEKFHNKHNVGSDFNMSGTNHKWSKERKTNHSKSMQCMIGNRNLEGYKHSEESRSKISKALKGKVFTDEHTSNISKSKMGLQLRKGSGDHYIITRLSDNEEWYVNTITIWCKEYEQLTGVKLSDTNLRNVSLGKFKQHKGFIARIVPKEERKE